MEVAALYLNAQKFQKEALAMCVVSDNVVTNKALSSSARATTFNEIVSVALSVALEN